MSGNYQNEKRRVEKLRNLMAESQVDLAVIPPGANFFYFSGLETEPMERLTLLMVTQDDATVISPKMLEEQIQSDTWISDIKSWTDSDKPYSIAEELISKVKPAKIAIEGSMPYFQFQPLFQGSAAETVTADSIIAPIRMYKDPEEIRRISAAVSGSEAALKETLDALHPGMTEREVAILLESNFMKKGLDRIAFSSIVAAGENSSVPHHSPTDRKIKKNEPIVIDFGGSYMGYSSDTTRTVFIGSAPEEIETIYEVNRQAQETAVNELNDSHKYADADRLAREVIEKAGFGSRFIHRVGHGLGIAVHEEPYLVPDNQEIIGENTVFTIEPGIYLPGNGGVRIEDTTLFSSGKCTPFNKFPKELTIL